MSLWGRSETEEPPRKLRVWQGLPVNKLTGNWIPQVQFPTPDTALQASPGDQKLRKAVKGFASVLASGAERQDDIIGTVVAING